MYIPPYASNHDRTFLLKFIREHSFGTLITQEPELNANHYPFLLTEENDELVLWTHLAKNNPQWKSFSKKECLAIFTGPHTYMSPTYYLNNLNVPTWNYTAVHATCSIEVVSDKDLEKKLMKELVSFYETKNETSWPYELPEDFHEKLLNAIVWLKLKVEKLEGKFKLSQNRDQSDYKNILKLFEESKRPQHKEVLHYMKLTNPFKNQKD